MNLLRWLAPIWLHFAVVSCVTDGATGRSAGGHSAPDFSEHEAQALSSVSPAAIVGMWYTKSSSSSMNFTSAYYFKSDGTGFMRSAVSGHEMQGNRDVLPFTWKYNGGGWWSGTHPQLGGFAPLTAQYRSDGKVLLLYLDCQGVKMRYVLSRAPQEVR